MSFDYTIRQKAIETYTKKSYICVGHMDIGVVFVKPHRINW